jgi:hypothetical protein
MKSKAGARAPYEVLKDFEFEGKRCIAGAIVDLSKEEWTFLRSSESVGEQEAKSVVTVRRASIAETDSKSTDSSALSSDSVIV